MLMPCFLLTKDNVFVQSMLKMVNETYRKQPTMTKGKDPTKAPLTIDNKLLEKIFQFARDRGANYDFPLPEQFSISPLKPEEPRVGPVASTK